MYSIFRFGEGSCSPRGRCGSLCVATCISSVSSELGFGDAQAFCLSVQDSAGSCSPKGRCGSLCVATCVCVSSVSSELGSDDAQAFCLSVQTGACIAMFSPIVGYVVARASRFSLRVCACVSAFSSELAFGDVVQVVCFGVCTR